MRFLGKIILYFVTALFSFLFFLYLTFPYQVLKENIAGILSKETGSLVSINTLEPSFPLGVKFTNIRVYRPGIESLTIGKLNLDVSFLSLLFGGVKADILLEDKLGGTLNIGAEISLSSLISNPEEAFPSYVSLNAENFDFSSALNFMLALQSGGDSVNPMVKSALRDIHIVGKLKSNTYFEFNEKDYLSSKGQIDIQLVNSGLELLSLPFQEFNQAAIKASLDKGSFSFSPETQFVSDGLKIEISGNVKQSEKIMNSKADIIVKIGLFNSLKENFGMILDMVTEEVSDGNMKVKVKGPISSPKVDVF